MPRTILVLSASVLALAAFAAPASATATTVRVTAKEYSFVLSTKRVKHGSVTFVIHNAGHTTHDFAIGGHTSPMIPPGRTKRLTVTLKPGRYTDSRMVDSHAQLGMKGVLRVYR